MGEITWKDELIRGLKHFGGEAHRKELFDYIKKTTNKNIPKKFTNTLQKELERLSKDSSNFSGVSIFYSVEGIGAGVWGINGYEPDENMDITQDDLSYPEGKEQLRKHIQKERNNKLIRDAKKMFKEKNGSIYCQICGIDFEKVYGEIGRDFIEAHHNKCQVADMLENNETKIEDLVMLCPNCHSMVHKLKLYDANINELQKILKRTPQY